MASRPLALLALAALLGAGLVLPAAGAAEDLTPSAEAIAPPADDGWDVEIVPYLWLTEVHGSMSVGGLTAPIDVGFDKVFDLLGAGDLIGGMGHFEARRRRIALFVDAVGSVVRTDQQLRAGKANLAADIATVEFGGGYRVYEAPGAAISVDGLVGGRYNYLYNSIAVDAASGEAGPQRGASTSSTRSSVAGGRFAWSTVCR